MRGNILAASLVIAVGVSTVGCKSAPKLAWWKTANKAEAESTVIAAGGPQLPSEAAKQAEIIAATGVSITPGGAATPYFSSAVSAPSVASATPAYTPSSTATPYPTTYPATGANAYTPSPVASIPVTPTTRLVAGNQNTGAMPYNPNAVPVAAPMVANSAPAPVVNSADRYASIPAVPAAVAQTPRVVTPTSPAASTDRYASLPPVTFNSTPSLPASPAMAPVAVNSPLANRYGAPAVASVQQQPESPTRFATSPMVAGGNPYRPGGTTSYPSAAPATPAIEVATRPQEPQSSVPNVATPQESTSTPRYW